MQLFPSHAQIPCRSLKEGSACIPTWGRGTAGFSEEENGQSHVFTGSFLLLFRQDFGQFNSFFPFFFFFLYEIGTCIIHQGPHYLGASDFGFCCSAHKLLTRTQSEVQSQNWHLVTVLLSCLIPAQVIFDPNKKKLNP